nr:nickel pincer cofactor biosynthesis protein LarC [Halobacteroides halobius]
MDKVLYFDCLAGVSGDMTIGALLDLGVDKEVFKEELAKLDIDGYKLKIEEEQEKGITGTDFKVSLEHSHHHFDEDDHHHHPHRNLADIEEIIESSQLSNYVKNLSKDIFREVAEAEAKVHNKPLDQVHFHEVGALDSIIDIVGAAICIEQLNVDQIIVSPLHTGTGFVHCAHGNIPVPAPATLEILDGVPVYSTGIKSELVTPTGAAIAKTLAGEFKPLPEMQIEQVGYGIGDKELEISNLLRVVLGKKKVRLS